MNSVQRLGLCALQGAFRCKGCNKRINDVQSAPPSCASGFTAAAASSDRKRGPRWPSGCRAVRRPVATTRPLRWRSGSVHDIGFLRVSSRIQQRRKRWRSCCQAVSISAHSVSSMVMLLPSRIVIAGHHGNPGRAAAGLKNLRNDNPPWWPVRENQKIRLPRDR